MQYQSIDSVGGSGTQKTTSSERLSATECQGLYQPGDTAEQLRALRQSLDDTQEVLQREQHRVQLLEAELLHLRSAQSAYLYRRSGDHASVSELNSEQIPGSTPRQSESTATGHSEEAGSCDVLSKHSRVHSIDKAALYEDGRYDRSAHHSLGSLGNLGSSVTVSREAFELLRLKDRAMDNTKEGITIADCSQADMPLIYANEAFARITGYSVAESLGKNCRFLQGPGTDEAPLQELRKAIRLGRSCVVQLVNYRRNGDAFVNYLSITPIHNDAGMLTHYVGIQSDITELVNHKKAELAAKHAAVQAAASAEAKSQFLARMSHEIRTPLNGMIAVGQLLAETALSPAQWDLVNTVRCSGETLLTLISDILDFSRIEANKMVLCTAPFRLSSVIEAAMEIAGPGAAMKRLQVAYHIAQDVPAVMLGDAQRLQQILLNVLNNAVKFTEAGAILLEVWAEPVPEAPEPQGCAATLEKEASGEQATMPPSLPAEGANAASLVALSTERMQVASAASRRLPQASAEQGQHTEAAPSQHGDLSQPAQQPPAVHSPSQPKESAGAAEEDNLLHPSLTTAPGSYIGNEDASSSPPLHPLLQVGLTSAPAPSSGAADSTASLPGSSHHASELSMAGLEGSLRAAADDPGVCGDGVALDAASTMSISPTDKRLPALDLSHARSASSGDLCEGSNILEQTPERNALSLPQTRSQSQAPLSSEPASLQNSQRASSSGPASLNRPQGIVPAVPEPASEQGGMNWPGGVVPSVPAGTSAYSSAQQAEQAHYSEEPARRIRRDRPVGQQAEYEQGDTQESWSSAAEAETGRRQQQGSDAVPDCGQGADNCASEGPELQGCKACLHKHQQLELASLKAKGLEDMSIGRRKATNDLQAAAQVSRQQVSVQDLTRGIAQRTAQQRSSTGAIQPKDAVAAARAALNIASSRQRLPAGVPQMTLEGEPAPAVSSPAAIQGAAVVVPKLDADVSPSETEGPDGRIEGASPVAQAAVKDAVQKATGPEVLIHFSVRDTGIGISQQNISRLFQSFSQVDASPTRRYGGSGLGLAISQKLAEAMGGSMWAESGGMGLGTRFGWTMACRLPPAEPAAQLLAPHKGLSKQRSLAVSLPPKASAENGQADMDEPVPLESRSQTTSIQRLNRSLWSDRSATNQSAPAGNTDNDLKEQTQRMLSGKKVLLVEPCDMVRQVNLLSLRTWGTSVCAVKTEDEAISRLKLRSGYGPERANGRAQAPRRDRAYMSSTRQSLHLEHAQGLEKECDVRGPFDVVLMDLALPRLLHALLQGDKEEASRVIFMGWPGQHELEDDRAAHRSQNADGVTGSGRTFDELSLPSLSLTTASSTSAQPPLALSEERVRAQNGRQLGYVVVTRPVRQGRLKLALEEVLSMTVDTPSSSRAMSECGRSDGRHSLDEPPAGWLPAPGARHMPKHHPAFHPSIDLSSEGVKRVPSGGQLKQAASKMAADARKPKESGEEKAAQMRVLIAEDNMINMKVALGILRRMGYEQVTHAFDGEEAYSAILERGGPDAFDVILMDLHMPRKGGMEVVRDVRQNWPDTSVRIIAVTADAFEDTRENCLRSGFDGWLAKPFRIEDLAAVMDAIPARQ